MVALDKIDPRAEMPAAKIAELDLQVLANTPVNSEYRQLILRAPKDLLESCRAGQFFHLLCPDAGGEHPYLRRPMSIYGYYPDRGELHFLYKVTGRGTRALGELVPGDALGVVGPLGVPFRIESDWRNLVLVARGVGLATLAPLALEAQRRGIRVTAICSARHPDYLMSIDNFRAMGADVVTITDAEGTSSTQNLRAILEDLVAGGAADALYTCGSNRMLKVVQQVARDHDIAGQIALEQQMACGIGMCHCCVRPFRRDGVIANLRVCREGPVFAIEEAIAW
ncbi:MAG: dihydroorotate dehydrogenase electron transfer subunit [Ahrensia sp.]|nr:dihydroorotate dehydrogenase electron transfer subunit [Ahrensia sp.]|tara:strand:- start:5941 stop:6786 length:846 start_codon:yes stop_codon:yes gene_type:complete